MCGIIGFSCTKLTQHHVALLTSVLLESGVRGLHAFGLAHEQNEGIVVRKWAKPITDRMSMQMVSQILADRKITKLIAHCRYSTSELCDNQPIADKNFALAHNGVISQEPPEQWKRLYGHKCSTRNDSELLWHSRLFGANPFETWPNASIAAVELSVRDGLRFYRNGKRPLFYAQGKDYVLVFSTEDIGRWAGLDALRTGAGIIYRCVDNEALAESKSECGKDLQP